MDYSPQRKGGIFTLKIQTPVPHRFSEKLQIIQKFSTFIIHLEGLKEDSP
jgi:hypothetical protein